MRRFLLELLSSFGNSRKYDDIREKIANLANTASRAPLDVVTGLPVEQSLSAASGIISPNNASLESQKKEVENALDDLNERLIIIIDDIDRLTPSEVSAMFKMIKSVADFPNATYVLAFDPGIISEALENVHNIESGDEYLRKIVQVSRHIPAPKKGSIERGFLKLLSDVVGPDDPISERDRWDELLKEGILPTIHTPRRIIRFVNAISVAHSSIGPEVNIVDLIGWELLREFYTDVYNVVSESPDQFVSFQYDSLENKDRIEYYKNILSSNSDEKDVVRSVLSILFPRVPVHPDRPAASHRNTENYYRKRMRICHPDVYNYYIRMTVPEGELPSNRIMAIISSIQNKQQFVENLRELSTEQTSVDTTNAYAFLNQFKYQTDDLDDEYVERLIDVFFEIGDELLEADPYQGVFKSGNLGNMRDITINQIRRKDRQERTQILENAIQNGDCISLAVSVIDRIDAEHDNQRYDSNEWTLSLPQLDQLKTIVAEKIDQLSENDDLIDRPQAGHTIHLWRQWSDSSAPSDWAERIADDPEKLSEYMRSIALTSDGEMVGVNPESLESLFDTEELRSLIHSNNNNYSPSDEAFSLFVRGMEIREEGNDPSDPLNYGRS